MSNQNSDNSVPFLDVLFRTLHYWPWILCSIAICMFFGVFYLLKTPKVYTETASVLIKEDSKGKSTATNINDFGDLGLLQTNTNIQNEVTSFKSPDLMEEVVKRLDLMMNYYLPGTFHKVVAYGTTNPVRISMPDFPDNEATQFNFRLDADGKYSVSNIRLNQNTYGTAYEKSFSGVLGDTVPSPMGPFVVTPSASYHKGKGVSMEVFKGSLKSTVNSYESRLAVKLDDKKGTIINLSFSDQNIQRADEVLNFLIGVYNENWIRDKNQIAVSTSNFINERLNVIEDELGHVDSDISSYKSENAIPDLSAAAHSYLAESQDLSQQLLALNNQLQMTRYIKGYLNSDGSNDKALPTNTGVENLDIQSQIGEYNAKLLERNALVAKSSEKNPLVQNMDHDLDAMRSAIIGSVDNSILNIQTQMKGLQGARGAATSRLAANPTQAKYLLSVERQQMVKENLYLFLLQKREDNELNQAFTAYNTRVIKRPGGSGAPTSPKSSLILTGCFLFGLFVPFAIVYGKEMTDTKVRGRKDVEDLAIPMLGEIPQVGKRKGITSRIFGTKLKLNKKKAGESSAPRVTLVKSGKRDSVNEAFRVLRTNTDFTRLNKEGCDVVAITSFNPSSGKSFIAMNLGVSLALKHHRVLVIDGDMRHASASAYIDKPKVGMANYLAGNENNIDSLLVPYQDIDNLYILPVGKIPPNPTELLESGRFGEMMEHLKKEFDFILIDCPPIEVVADAQIIDKFADRTVFVIRAGLLERTMLPVLEKLYTEKKFNRMAFILNGTMNEKGRYGYTYSYKYGYGYGYGYGYEYHSDSDS
ncbi:MAG: polysaccharide biosynthesis tyrosine autokinase [Muribaculaceae bacterium]|nr:polysaccharide biosynthesis tyrosine autokinase [Muribaculaceae bacterium]